MSLAAEIKKSMFAAMKAKQNVEKEILRVAMGEITKTGDEPDDAAVQGILKKLIKSNREAQAASEDAEVKVKLDQEIAALETFLPKTLSVAQITEALAPVAEQIKAAPNQGPAMGLAMKTLKAAGAEADAGDVAKAVTALRS
jgi:uncharacterized protein YqeY